MKKDYLLNDTSRSDDFTQKGFNGMNTQKEVAVFKQDSFGTDSVFTENIVDRFKRSRGFYYDNKKDVIGLLGVFFVLYPTMALSIAALKHRGMTDLAIETVWTAYLMSSVGTLVVIFLAWLVYSINIRLSYSKWDVKTEKAAWRYKSILREYFVDFISTGFLHEESDHATTKMINTRALVNFDTQTNADQMFGLKEVGSRVIMLRGYCKSVNSREKILLTLKFNKNFSKLRLQEYSVEKIVEHKNH